MSNVKSILHLPSGLLVAALLALFTAQAGLGHGNHNKPCTGPHSSDPGCGTPPPDDPVLGTYEMTLKGSPGAFLSGYIFGTVPSSVRHQNPDPMNGNQLIFFGCGGGQSAGTFCPTLDGNGECCNQLSLAAVFTVAESAVESGTPCSALSTINELAHSPQFAELTAFDPNDPVPSTPDGLGGETRNSATILIEEVGAGAASVLMSFRGVGGDGTVLKAYTLDLEGTFPAGNYPPAPDNCVDIDLTRWDLSVTEGKGKKNACTGTDDSFVGHGIKVCRTDTS